MKAALFPLILAGCVAMPSDRVEGWPTTMTVHLHEVEASMIYPMCAAAARGPGSLPLA